MIKERYAARSSLHQTPMLILPSEDGLSSPMSAQNGQMNPRHSKKGAWPTASPTYASYLSEGKAPVDVTALDPSAAALAASSHLTASINESRGPTASPNPAPSPTSPNYLNRSGYSARDPASNVVSRANNYSSWDSNTYVASSHTSSSTLGLDSAPSHRGAAPTPTPTTSRVPRSKYMDDEPDSARGDGNNGGQSSTPSVEIFKSFRVSMEDPCHKVLPAALKKYNINADWRQYALYIVYGDQERCLGLDEKPLILFKQLDKEGKKPMFMLRRHAAPVEGHSGPSTASGMPNNVSNFERSGAQIQLPGGVL